MVKIVIPEKKKVVYSNKLLSTDKTTNINILLNRVKIDKKKDLKKKFIFISLLFGVVTLIGTITLI